MTIMATRRSLYSDYLKTWAARLQGDGFLTAEQKASIDRDLGVDKFHETISEIQPVVTGALSKVILKKMDDIQGIEGLLDEEVQTVLTFQKYEVEQHREYCYKDFSYSATSGDLYVITALRIKNSVVRGGFVDADWKILEQMMLKDVTTCDFLYYLAQDLNHNKNMVYVLTGQADPNVWRLYSYAYLCHINNESIAIPSVLSYPSTTNFDNTGITYKNDVVYEQYFEAYHVMNEAKHVEDILGRYLRMYQVLEQFSYRKKLVAICSANNRNSAFVRNVMKYTSKTIGDEKGQFIDGLKAIFTDLDHIITDADINPYDAFLKDVYQIGRGNHNSNKVGSIIYALRNSIVHNKESELHFTYGNVDEYKDGIQLMKGILPKMEKEIVKLINTPGSPISYGVEKMPLY